VKSAVLRHHFNIGNADYAEWLKKVDQEIPALTAGDDNVFHKGIEDLLERLKSSHTAFLPPDSSPPKPQYAIGVTLRPVSRFGLQHWMVLDVYDEGIADHAGIRPGHLLLSVNGHLTEPPTLPTFRFGEEYKLAVQTADYAESQTVILTVPVLKGLKRRLPLIEPKSVSYRMLSANVGLLRVPFFSGTFGVRFSQSLDAAVQMLKAQGCDRLVIDLRGCMGGGLGFARLASYLCDDQVPIGYDVTRKRLIQGYNVADLPRVRMPNTALGVLVCLARFSVQDKSLVLLTQGLGKQPFHGRVVVLINEWTASAGEMTAQFAKDTKLATLIGQKTMGQVLGSEMFSVGYGYRVYLPVFGWYSPTGNYTEAAGIEPDVSIDVDPDSLARGQDAQLERALLILQ
jgi:C-terminal processing protease CtpA/Prc